MRSTPRDRAVAGLPVVPALVILRVARKAGGVVIGCLRQALRNLLSNKLS